MYHSHLLKTFSDPDISERFRRASFSLLFCSYESRNTSSSNSVVGIGPGDRIHTTHRLLTWLYRPRNREPHQGIASATAEQEVSDSIPGLSEE